MDSPRGLFILSPHTQASSHFTDTEKHTQGSALLKLGVVVGMRRLYRNRQDSSMARALNLTVEKKVPTVRHHYKSVRKIRVQEVRDGIR